METLLDLREGLATAVAGDEKDRETKITQFAKKYGFRLRFYGKGLCAIFDKWPPSNGK